MAGSTRIRHGEEQGRRGIVEKPGQMIQYASMAIENGMADYVACVFADNPVKEGKRRVVGIFYIAWHRDRMAKGKPPYAADVTKILSTDPAARLDAKHPLWRLGTHPRRSRLGLSPVRDRSHLRSSSRDPDRRPWCW